jgi:hypothetical protein
MIPLRFGYLILVIVGMIFWTTFFILRKDLRKTMVLTGIFYGVLSLVTAQIWWTVDWWHPLTLTGTRVGIEDFFTGFGAGGVMMVIYQVFFSKKITFPKLKTYPIARILFSVIVLLTIEVLIYYAGLTSFESFTLMVWLGTIFMWTTRRDLIVPSIWSGVLTMICILPAYYVTILTVPGWVSATYYFNHLPTSMLITGIPIVELIFWLTAGSFIGILGAFTRSGKFVTN